MPGALNGFELLDDLQVSGHIKSQGCTLSTHRRIHPIVSSDVLASMRVLSKLLNAFGFLCLMFNLTPFTEVKAIPFE